MAFWKIKFEEENKFVERCVYVHVIRVRKQVVLTYIKFIAGFMFVATACRVDERKFVGFSFWI